MFYTRRERERVDGLERKLLLLEAQREEQMRVLQHDNERFADLLALHTEAHRSFQKVADQYTEGLERARDTIAELQAAPPTPAPIMRQEPLHMTEEEEDLEFALNTGSISLDRYNELIREAGLGN